MQWTSRIGQRLKLRDLHILLAVVESGSMGKAATSLAVSQPVVSKAIADLEYSLGVRLLDRGPRGVSPTIYGEQLLKSGLSAFDSLRQGVEAIDFLADPAAGNLRLGCTEPLAAGFVGAVIERLSRDYPRITFEVVTADPLSLRDRELRQRTIEFAVTPTEGLADAPDTNVEILFDDRQVVVIGSTSKWARRRRIALPALLQEPWFLPPPDTIIGSYIIGAFRAAGLSPPKPQIQSFSVPLCLRLVATGRFITMLPLSMVALGSYLPLKLLPLGSPIVPRPTGILALRNRTRSPVAELFIDCARAVVDGEMRKLAGAKSMVPPD